MECSIKGTRQPREFGSHPGTTSRCDDPRLVARDHPEWFSRPYLMKTKLMNRVWARQSTLVLTPSQFSADRAVAVLGLDPARVHVVGNAHRWGENQVGRRARVRDEDPYVLTISTLSTRKNLRLIVDAWEHVRSRLPDFHLKVIGAEGGSVLTGTTAAVDGTGVDYLGYISDQELEYLMLGAEAVVSASLYEGFNIPTSMLSAPEYRSPSATSQFIERSTAGPGRCLTPKMVPRSSRLSKKPLTTASARPFNRPSLNNSGRQAVVGKILDSVQQVADE